MEQEAEVMKCSQEECGGEVNLSIGVSLQTGCSGCCALYSTAFPCIKCRRLHWPPDPGSDGNGKGRPVFNRQGNPAFFQDGCVIIKSRETGEEIMRW